MPRRKRESGRLIAGIIVATITIVGGILLRDNFHTHRDLYALSIVSLLLAASALMAEPLMITPAVIEIILGLIAGLSGVPITDTIDLLAMIGSVFIMYMAGLEINTGLLRKSIKGALIVGFVSFLAPSISVFAGLTLLGYNFEESMLTAIGTSTTSVAVVYAIIRRRGLARRLTGQLILAGAMVADVTSILAFVLLEAGLTIPVLIYFSTVFFIAVGLARFLEWVAGGEHEIELRLILSFLIAASLVSEYVGVHAILFAFLLGIASRSTVAKSSILEEKLVGLTFGLLAPLFFINAGLHATPEDPVGYSLLAALLLFLSLPVKILATHLALIASHARTIKLRLSTVFGARLTVSTVIAFTGQATGKLPVDLAGAIIMSALVATVISAIISGGPIPEESIPSRAR